VLLSIMTRRSLLGEQIDTAIETEGWGNPILIPSDHNGGGAFGNTQIRPVPESSNFTSLLLLPRHGSPPGAIKAPDFMEKHLDVCIAGSSFVLMNPGL